jgi:5-methyltetrahydrofolate--homocysteine methyltransferase
MIIIGEKINGTRKAVAKAIADRDDEFIQKLAKSQAAAGAAYLDVNAGTVPEREPEDMVWLIQNIQSVVDIPLCLDSANPTALQAGLKSVSQPALINSLSGEKARVEGVLPLALEYQTGLIILALDDAAGIPETSEGRMAIIGRLVDMALKGGLGEEKLFIDPLVTAISTGTDNAKVTFDTIRRAREKYPLAHITSGLSNISFGMPLRPLLNRTFLAMCIQAGMDSAIADPNDRELMGTAMAAETLMGLDRYCLSFNKAFRAGRIGPVKTDN